MSPSHATSGRDDVLRHDSIDIRPLSVLHKVLNYIPSLLKGIMDFVYIGFIIVLGGRRVISMLRCGIRSIYLVICRLVNQTPTARYPAARLCLAAGNDPLVGPCACLTLGT